MPANPHPRVIGCWLESVGGGEAYSFDRDQIVLAGTVAIGTKTLLNGATVVTNI